MYIPDVTLGRPARTGSRARNTRDYGAERRRGRRSRTKLTLAGGGLFLVVLAAGLLTFMSGVRQLGDSSHTSTTAGLTPPTAYEGREEQPVIQEEPAWWKPTATPDPLASGVPAPRNTDRVESYEQNPPAGLASVDVGRGPERTITEPIINPDRRREQEGGGGTPTSNALGASAQPDTTSHAVPTAPDLRKEPQVAAPPTPPTAEPRSRPPASAQAKAEPQPQQGQVKAPVPQAKPSTAPAKTTAARSREIENLLAEGDARLAEGDLDAARSAYEQAYDKGSRAAAFANGSDL